MVNITRPYVQPAVHVHILAGKFLLCLGKKWCLCLSEVELEEIVEILDVCDVINLNAGQSSTFRMWLKYINATKAVDKRSGASRCTRCRSYLLWVFPLGSSDQNHDPATHDCAIFYTFYTSDGLQWRSRELQGLVEAKGSCCYWSCCQQS